MNPSAEMSLTELALDVPGALRVVDAHAFDYCCGGARSLREACTQADLPIERVLAELEADQAHAVARGELPDLRRATLASLALRITQGHHVFARGELQRLRPLMSKVFHVHGARHPELGRVAERFEALADELASHLEYEEEVLLPAIVDLEAARSSGHMVERSRFGTVAAQVSRMRDEHHALGALLLALREHSQGYALPEGACNSYRALYQGLLAFERNLMRHVHLENDALFPRAVALEHAAPSA